MAGCGGVRLSVGVDGMGWKGVRWGEARVRWRSEQSRQGKRKEKRAGWLRKGKQSAMMAGGQGARAGTGSRDEGVTRGGRRLE